MQVLKFVQVALALTITLGAPALEQVTLATKGKIRRYIDIGWLNRSCDRIGTQLCES